MGTKGDAVLKEVMAGFGALLVTALLVTGAFTIGLRLTGNPQPEQVIHVFTHTVDDREVRCIHFSEYGLSCDWTYGDREGIN